MLSRPTARRQRNASTRPRSRPAGTGGQAGTGLAAGTANRRLKRGTKVARTSLAAARSVAPPPARARTPARSWKVPQARSIQALGLRRAGPDRGDPELREHPGELGGLVALLRTAACRREHRRAVAVHRGRPAEPAGHVAQDQQVPDPVLGLAERGAHDRAGRVVDPADQGQPGPATLQRVVAAAVDLDRQALLGRPLAPPRVARWPALAGRRDPARPEQPAQRRTADDDALLLGQHLREVGVVEAAVRGRGQLHDAVRQLVGQPPGRGPAPVAVGEPGGTVGSIAARSRHAVRSLQPSGSAASLVVTIPASQRPTTSDRCCSLAFNVRLSLIG